MLTNAGSDRVRRVRALARRRSRLEAGRLLVEGPQACREAAAAGLVEDLYWTPDAARRHPQIGDGVASAGGYAHLASPAYVDAISADAQGVVAVAEDPWAGLDLAAALAALAGRARLGVPLAAVFEQVQDPGNAGAVIRSADAAGVDLVLFADGSADPTAPKVVRASTGSYFHLPVLSAGPVAGLVESLRGIGLQLVATDGAGEAELGGPELPWGGPALACGQAWLFGNEAHGLSGAALDAADLVVRLPIYGRAESLNVAQAATLCLYAAQAARRGLTVQLG
ncbi:MAG: RNA methyltransferase [Bifidobacteriaceae bacterium]|jgi:TrmH family RNA methyltransferase|nr:RNA methyltransferase [Bifidobacteriaceae bacterium]